MATVMAAGVAALAASVGTVVIGSMAVIGGMTVVVCGVVLFAHAAAAVAGGHRRRDPFVAAIRTTQ